MEVIIAEIWLCVIIIAAIIFNFKLAVILFAGYLTMISVTLIYYHKTEPKEPNKSKLPTKQKGLDLNS
jgi:accessory gene regulator protein AgrB